MWEAMIPHRLIASVAPKFSVGPKFPVSPKFSIGHARRGLPLTVRAMPTALPVNG